MQQEKQRQHRSRVVDDIATTLTNTQRIMQDTECSGKELRHRMDKKWCRERKVQSKKQYSIGGNHQDPNTAKR